LSNQKSTRRISGDELLSAFAGCVSAFFTFLYNRRYCFLAIYAQSNILIHQSLL